MPKLKTKKSAAKRFKLTASGKVKRHTAYGSHILTSKTRKRKRGLRKNNLVSSTEAKNVKMMIPYN
ncbi:MAG: 50S ribosomal protein L35 [Candidatus Schekmanbacteria bacterium]|nr:50S ribosomal protein L35 [Candidatus Schekmanbacteria bacterium]